MTRLAVVLDSFAWLRQARKRNEPDPVACAHLAALAGADAITVHLRADRRHIQDRDLEILRKSCSVPLNLRISTNNEMVTVASEKKPDLTTLVPERQDEVSVESGLDVVLHQDRVRRAVIDLREGGIPVHMVLEPEIEQMKAAARAGCDGVELYVGRFTMARDARTRQQELQRLQEAARAAEMLELQVAAGGSITYSDVPTLAAILEITTLHIGHAVAARACQVGIDTAVRDLKALMRKPHGGKA